MKLFIVNILLLTSTATGYQFKFPWSKNLVPIDRQSTQTVESSRVVAKDLRKIAASLVLTGGLFSSSITNLYPAIAADYPSIQAAESQMITLFERNVPSVVYINTFVERIDAFSMNVMEVAAGTGTGFVWDKNGHIVTNFHVIRNAGSAKVTVTSPDGKVTKTYRANVIGVDPDKDVAVLTVDAGTDALTWQPVSLGKSANLKVGQTAIAIGNPFGLDHTLTTGVISGLGREVRSPNNRPISNVIQTGNANNLSFPTIQNLTDIIILDASINPGNSGGPLLDSAGNLIGMNTVRKCYYI